MHVLLMLTHPENLASLSLVKVTLFMGKVMMLVPRINLQKEIASSVFRKMLVNSTLNLIALVQETIFYENLKEV